MNFTTTPTPSRSYTASRGSAKYLQQARAKRAGGPIDRAHYECNCGHSFRAAVSTSVPCPRCGQGQAW